MSAFRSAKVHPIDPAKAGVLTSVESTLARVRGRPMPSDRHRWRAVLLATGIACSAIPAGCFTSPFVRRAADPAPDPSRAATAIAVPNNADYRSDAPSTIPPGRVDSSVRSASVHAADGPAAASLATPLLTAPGGSSPMPAAEFPLELQTVPAGSRGKGTGKGIL
jgi:hypothetical protein